MSDMSDNRCPYCPVNNENGQNNGNNLEEYPYLNRYTPLERELLHEEIYGQSTQNKSSQIDSSQSTDYNCYNENINQDTLTSYERAFEQRTLEGAEAAMNMHQERDIFEYQNSDSGIQKKRISFNFFKKPKFLCFLR